MSQHQPRAVLFDLGNTLVSYYKAAEFGPILDTIVDDLLHYLARQDRHYDRSAILAKARTLNVEREDLCVYPLVLRLQALFDLDENFCMQHQSELAAHFLAPIFATARIDAYAAPLLAALRGRGILTAIVSNTPWGSPGDPWRAELARHGLRADVLVFCVDCGKRKPAAYIFEYALKRLGVRAEEAVFVGDDVRWDVIGAREAGMQAVLLDPAGTQTVNNDVVRIRSLGELLPWLEREGLIRP